MDRPIYYAKIFCTKKNKSKITASGCYANSIKQAESVFQKMVERWNVDEFEILKVSDKPFVLKRYVGFVSINFKSGDKKDCELYVKEENPQMAEKLLLKTLMNSKKVRSYQVFQIEEVKDLGRNIKRY